MGPHSQILLRRVATAESGFLFASFSLASVAAFGRDLGSSEEGAAHEDLRLLTRTWHWSAH